VSAGIDPHRLIHANTTAVGYFRDHLAGHLPALRYLHSRAVVATTAIAEPWTVGYAPRSWDALHTHLTGLGFTGAEQLAAGLVTTSIRGSLIDVFHDRVMFPIRNRDGQVVAFTGRFIGTDRPGAAATPRYRNTIGTAVYRKKHQLYGLSEQLTGDIEPAAVMLVEGPTDVLAIARIRRTVSTGHDPSRWWAVAPCGTVLTAEQVALLADSVPPATPVVVAFDADTAGAGAADRSHEMLRGWPGPVEAIALPAGQDPASLVAAHGARAAAGILDQARRPLVDLVMEHRLAAVDLTHLDDRLRALRLVAPLAAEVAARDVDHAARLALALTVRLALNPLTVYEAISPPVEDSPPDRRPGHGVELGPLSRVPGHGIESGPLDRVPGHGVESGPLDRRIRELGDTRTQTSPPRGHPSRSRAGRAAGKEVAAMRPGFASPPRRGRTTPT
jgi:DNA primase catalytic core